MNDKELITKLESMPHYLRLSFEKTLGISAKKYKVILLGENVYLGLMILTAVVSIVFLVLGKLSLAAYTFAGFLVPMLALVSSSFRKMVLSSSEVEKAINYLEEHSSLGENVWYCNRTWLVGFIDAQLCAVARRVIDIEISNLPKEQKDDYSEIERANLMRLHKLLKPTGLVKDDFKEYYGHA